MAEPLTVGQGMMSRNRGRQDHQSGIVGSGGWSSMKGLLGIKESDVRSISGMTAAHHWEGKG